MKNIKELPELYFLAALFSLFFALNLSVYFGISFELSFRGLYIFITLASFFIYCFVKYAEWRAGSDDASKNLYKKSLIPLCTTNALLLGFLLAHPLFHEETASAYLCVIIVIPVLTYYASKFRMERWKSHQANMMITVRRPEGDFQSVWVLRSEGSEIWCMSYDKNDHGILFRRIDENKKGSEGHITLEYGARKAKLFEWDGNKELISSGEKRGRYRYDGPEYGVPLNASLLQEVKF